MNVRSIVTSITVIAVLSFSLLATAQEEGQPDMVKLVEDVRAVAGELEASITGLEEALIATTDPDQGAELLDQMHASAEAVHAKLAEDSEIWAALVEAMEVWDERRAQYLEKSETNAAFKAIADEWELKVEQAGELRKQILTQRAESLALLDHIGAEREIVLAYYELGQADRALETMRQVSDGLGRMNDSMRAMVEQTREVAGEAIPE